MKLMQLNLIFFLKKRLFFFLLRTQSYNSFWGTKEPTCKYEHSWKFRIWQWDSCPGGAFLGWSPLESKEPNSTTLLKLNLASSFLSLELESYIAFLRSHSKHVTVLLTHHVNTRTNCATAYPIHQKFWPLPYIRNQLVDHFLITHLRRKTGDNTDSVMGNWSAPNPKIHEPIYSVGFSDVPLEAWLPRIPDW